MSEPDHKAEIRRSQLDVIASIHKLADRLEHEEQIEFGKSVICTGAAIVAQTQGPEEMRAVLQAMSWTAKAAYDEGRAEA